MAFANLPIEAIAVRPIRKMSKPYSTRSCPSSSCQSRFKRLVMFQAPPCCFPLWDTCAVSFLIHYKAVMLPKSKRSPELSYVLENKFLNFKFPGVFHFHLASEIKVSQFDDTQN